MTLKESVPKLWNLTINTLLFAAPVSTGDCHLTTLRTPSTVTYWFVFIPATLTTTINIFIEDMSKTITYVSYWPIKWPATFYETAGNHGNNIIGWVGWNKNKSATHVWIIILLECKTAVQRVASSLWGMLRSVFVRQRCSARGQEGGWVGILRAYLSEQLRADLSNVKTWQCYELSLNYIKARLHTRRKAANRRKSANNLLA